MKNAFIDTIKSIVNIPDDQINELLQIVKQATLRKGEHFIRAGSIPYKFGFNLKGLFRYYYIDSEGNDFTKSFVAENNFVTSYTAMVQNTGSYYSIEALEDSSILVINYSDWQNLMQKNICWILLVKSLIEAIYIRKENREKGFLLDDAKTRYRNFLEEFPGLDSRIKQYHIASYLGITPVALSRIKKTLK